MTRKDLDFVLPPATVCSISVTGPCLPYKNTSHSTCIDLLLRVFPVSMRSTLVHPVVLAENFVIILETFYH